MTRKYSFGLHIFRRDLRLEDNTALLRALGECEEVACCFIFNPVQIRKHDYRSEPGLAFLQNSLIELNETLERRGARLQFFYGAPEEVLQAILRAVSVDAVYLNLDYTPFSRSRDKRISDVCDGEGVMFHGEHDALLQPPGAVLKGDGNPYTVYTPFARAARKISVVEPRGNRFSNFSTLKCDFEDEQGVERISGYGPPEPAVKGGRDEALRLKRCALELKDYNEIRDIPSVRGTSLLSAHHKFGTISARESYASFAEALGREHSLISELYWRDFFTHIGWHFPHVFEGAFREKYDGMKWDNNEDHFEAWCDGRTGFPIVDAGMRELKATGYMHNRVRMIVASFLTKDLLIDWRWGERFFARSLFDYDPSVNNGNWQWAASTGCDAQPYFRIFNPWLQQKKFDPDATYIKKWIPELSAMEPGMIHNLGEADQPLFASNYPRPIVDHRDMRDEAEDRYRSCAKS